jgi:hypothetical protein
MLPGEEAFIPMDRRSPDSRWQNATGRDHGPALRRVVGRGPSQYSRGRRPPGEGGGGTPSAVAGRPGGAGGSLRIPPAFGRAELVNLSPTDAWDGRAQLTPLFVADIGD